MLIMEIVIIKHVIGFEIPIYDVVLQIMILMA